MQSKSRVGSRRLLPVGALILVLLVAVVLAACGGSTTTTTGAPSGDTSATTAGEPTQSTEASTATTASGKQFTVGILNPTSQNLALTAYSDAIRGVLDRYGIKRIELDDQLKPDKQLADIDQLITQKVDAMIVWPLDPASLDPALQRAKAAGIKLFAVDYNPDLGGPQGPFISQASIASIQWGKECADYMAANLKPGAKVMSVGIAFPVPSITAQMNAFKEEAIAKGLTFLEQQDNPTDDAAGARTLAVNMFTKFPEVDGAYGYNEPSAIGISSAATAAGRKLWDGKEGLMIIGRNGGPDGAQAIQDGKIWASSDGVAWKAGWFMAEAAAQLLLGIKTEAQIPKDVSARSPMIMKSNMATEYHPFSEVYDNMFKDTMRDQLPKELQ